jgi:FkbM family methyltransferase
VGGKYEREIRALFRKICQKRRLSSFFDVGANVGIFSGDFLSLHERNQVVAFEPHPLVFRCLEKTKRKAGLERWHLFQQALAEKKGRAPLHYDPLAPARSAMEPSKEGLFSWEKEYNGPTESKEVEMTTLDLFMNEHPTFCPEIVKVDIEGSEWRFFQGAEKTLERLKPILFFECTENAQEIYIFLRDLGYLCFSLELQELKSLGFFNVALPTSP